MPQARRTETENIYFVTTTDVAQSTRVMLHRLVDHEQSLVVLRRGRPIVAIVPVTQAGRPKSRLPFSK